MTTMQSGAQAIPATTGGFHGAFTRGDETARRFLPRHPGEPGDWESRIAHVERRDPATAVWERAARDLERLGGDEQARAGAERLARGEALCVTTGQQPGLLLGPLYTIYKAMTAVALARRLERKAERPVVPVFWSAADDSDFGEVGSAILAGEDFSLQRYALHGGDLRAGGMVGDLSTDGTRDILRTVEAEFAREPSGDVILRHLERALDVAKDHGELTTALLYDLFRGTGMVVVDGRWPELRREAQPLFRRYAEAAATVGEDVRGAGRALTDAGFVARITDGSTEAALFDIRDGRRLAFEGTPEELAARVDAAPESLSPNVMLRPMVQDSLFPNVATVGGPGEVSYHAQLAPAYARLGVDMPILFPRFEATLVPDGVAELASRRGRTVLDFVTDFDAVLRETSEAAAPGALASALRDFERAVEAGTARVRDEAVPFDEKLAGAVDESARRIRESVERLRDRVAKAVRQAEARRDPAVKHYRDFLRPRGVPQERVLSSLTLFLASEEHPLGCLEGLLEEHLEATRDGRPTHWLVPFGACRPEDAA